MLLAGGNKKSKSCAGEQTALTVAASEYKRKQDIA
jgi:hypothetical protein